MICPPPGYTLLVPDGRFLTGGDYFLYNKVELCGVNTSRLRVLTNDEIYALLRRLRGIQSAPCPQVSCRRGFLPGNILYKPIDFMGNICYAHTRKRAAPRDPANGSGGAAKHPAKELIFDARLR